MCEVEEMSDESSCLKRLLCFIARRPVNGNFTDSDIAVKVPAAFVRTLKGCEYFIDMFIVIRVEVSYLTAFFTCDD